MQLGRRNEGSAKINKRNKWAGALFQDSASVSFCRLFVLFDMIGI